MLVLLFCCCCAEIKRHLFTFEDFSGETAALESFDLHLKVLDMFTECC